MFAKANSMWFLKTSVFSGFVWPKTPITNRRLLFYGVLLSSFLAIGFQGHAQSAPQQQTSSFELGGALELGKILKIYPDLPPIGNVWTYKLDFDWKTTGRQWWNKAYRYPTLGCQVVVGSLGNPEVLGVFAAVLPNLRFKLFGAGHHQVYTRIGMGFAYFNKPYNQQSNPTNLLVGSALTNITSLQLVYSAGVSRFLSLNAGVGFQHFSNGHTQLPNVGINMPSAQLGFSLLMYQKPVHKLVNVQDSTPNREYTMDAIVGLGWHEFGETTEPTGGIKYPVYSFGLAISKNLGTIHVVQLGVTYSYYTSFRDYIAYQSFFNEQLALNASTFSIYAGHEFILGHLGLDLKLGAYLYNPFRRKYNHEVLNKPNGFKEISTNKLGINYYFSDTRLNRKGLYIGLHIKANLGQADFAEFSMGYRF